MGYDYMFDETENFGERGYSCWDIRILINVNEGDSDDSDRLKELFPESSQNKVSSHRNYEEASDYWGEFCKVEVRLV